MIINFSDDAKASGDAEATVLHRLVGFAFLVKRSGVPNIEGVLESVDNSTNRATFSTWSDAAMDWRGIELTVDIGSITELTYV